MTGTGDPRALGSLARHLVPYITTDTVRRDVARRRRLWFASFPPFSRNGWLTVLREGLLAPLEMIS
jgi:hypothetical protein